MREIVYMVYSGFNIIYINNLREKYSIENYKNTSVTKWKYLVLPKKIVTFPIVFKYIFDRQGMGFHYVKIRFREQLHNPVEMLLDLVPIRTIYLINSNPKPSRLFRRLFANPRYSETIMLLAEINDDPMKDLERYNDLIRLARKLFMELTSLVYKKGVGRFNALRLVEREGLVDIIVCVTRKGAFLETSYGDVKVTIKDIDSCLPS